MALHPVSTHRRLAMLAHISRVLALLVFIAQPTAQSTAGSDPLDFEYFKMRVQPIFLAKRPGHARCISCHAGRTPMPLQRLDPGRTAWNDEESRRNFEAARKMVVPGSLKSKLLVHPLATDAGGDLFHNGGKHWNSQSDPEWQILAAWVRGERGPSQRERE